MKHVAADAANEFRKFIPFSKVEEMEDGSVIVEGIATAEVLDSQGEIVGYEASKAAFEEWSDVFSKMTDGASLGNIREMHGPVAAGKAVAWWADDAKKSIVLRSKIVDAGAAKKCREKVYTGYSIAAPGDSVERKKVKFDGKEVPYISKYRLSETSTVDRPACPDAVFTLVKRDGGSPAPLQKDAKAIAMKAAAAAQAIRELQAELVIDEKVPCWSQREALTALENVLGVKMEAEWLAQAEAVEAAMNTAGADKVAKAEEPPADPPAPAPAPVPAPDGEQPPAPPADGDPALKAKSDPPAPAHQPEPVKKLETSEALEKILAGQDALKASVATITEKVTGVVAKQEETATAMKGLEGRLSKVESTPAAAGSPAQVVEKSLGAISSAGIVPSPSEMRKTVDALEVSGQVPAATIAEMRKGLATLELMKASAAR